MKLGIATCILREKLGDGQALTAIARAGFDCVDYSYFQTEKYPEILGDDFRAYAKKIRGMMDSLNLTCGQAHAPYGFSFCNEMRESDPEFRLILRSMEAAAILGAPYIVVHPVLSPVYVDMPEYNARFFQALEPYCGKFGIRIAIENIFDREPAGRCMGRFGTPERMGDLISRLSPDSFAVCLDTGHAAVTGVNPEDFIRAMGADRLRVLHLQDTCLLDDDHMLPLLGDQPWEPVCKALAETGYQGDLSLEVPGYLHRLDPELLPSALALACGVGRWLIRKVAAYAG